MEIDGAGPLPGVSLRTPRLELRPMREDDIAPLVDVALEGIHDPARMPFGVPWTDAAPAVLARSFGAYHRGLRANITPEEWAVSFTVLLDDRPVGVQELSATAFASRRTVESGSWLTSRVQGDGLGTEMRAGVLLFAFDHLGAEWAESSAMAWNAPSIAVSRRLGYRDHGTRRAEPRPGEVVDELVLRVGAPDLVRPSWALGVTCPPRVLALLGAVRAP